MDWHHYSLDQVDTWADRIVEAAWEHGFEWVEFVHGAPDIGTRGSFGRRSEEPAEPARDPAGARDHQGAAAPPPVRQPLAPLGARACAQGMHRVEEGHMLIALRENPTAGEAREVAADPAACARVGAVAFRSRAALHRDLRARLPARDDVDQRAVRTNGNAPRAQRAARVVLGPEHPSTPSARLPYVLEWHRRYEALGLRVIGVHSPSSTSVTIPPRSRRPCSGSRSRSPSPAIRTTRSGVCTGTRCGPRSTCGTAAACCATTTSPRALYDETEERDPRGAARDRRPGRHAGDRWRRCGQPMRPVHSSSRPRRTPT